MKLHSIKHILYTLLSVIFLLPTITRAQKTLKPITESDYHLWYDLHLSKLSQNGSWVSYTLSNLEIDSLCIQETKGTKSYRFKDGYGLQFLGDHKAAFGIKNQMVYLDLTSGHMTYYPKKTEFAISDDQTYIFRLEKDTNKLSIIHDRDSDSLTISNVNKYSYDETSDRLAIIIKDLNTYSMEVIALKKGFPKITILAPQKRPILQIGWHPKGKALAYALASSENSAGFLGYYHFENKTEKHFDPLISNNFPKSHILEPSWEYPFMFSLDGSKIFFAHKRREAVQSSEIPQVWKYTDPFPYKIMNATQGWKNTSHVSVWDVKKNKSLRITDEEFPQAIYKNANNQVLVYNQSTYGFKTHYRNRIDLYGMNLVTGKRTLLIKKYDHSINQLKRSPSGRFLLYGHQGQWWCYDMKKQKKINLTAKYSSPESYKIMVNGLEPPVGWNENETAVFMYDKYDLWKVFLDDKTPVRITRGKEKGITYSLINPHIKSETPYVNEQALFFSMTKGLLRGYAYSKNKKNIHPINFKSFYTERSISSPDGKSIAYTTETNKRPTAIKYFSIKNKKLKTLVQSNPHYKTYQWYHTDTITYSNKQGKRLIGTLRYPIGYQKDSLYPMIVNIYEKKSQFYNDYINPSQYNHSGVNASNLTSKGYFVFLPDIVYEVGEPGFSAVDCIVSGTKAAIKTAAIDPKRIGLTGYSFGGYETMFTITQTHLFTAAAAGAGISSFNWNYVTTEQQIAYRYYMHEDYQFRLKNSLYDDYQGYLDNSPLYHAKNVQTPLLLYAGDKDDHVSYKQSIAFHLALKRLHRENALLIYPGETHSIIAPTHQRDITRKIEQWFGHYLKDESKAGWMP